MSDNVKAWMKGIRETMTLSDNAIAWIKDIAVAIIIGLVLIQFIKPTIVKEHSMQPTLNENDYVFLSKQAYFFGEPKYEDIIVFHSDLTTADGSEKMLIKRIIGLPGDTIAIANGVVYRNGTALTEEYTLEEYTSGSVADLVVPDDYIFVMGDNRQNSIDSRSSDLGCVPMNSVVGKAFFRLFPFNKIGLLN